MWHKPLRCDRIFGSRRSGETIHHVVASYDDWLRERTTRTRAATALAVASLDGSMARLDRFRRELRAVARGELALDDFVALALSPAYFGEAGRGRADRRRHDAVATEAGHRGARASDSDGNTRSPVVTSDRAGVSADTDADAEPPALLALIATLPEEHSEFREELSQRIKERIRKQQARARA